MTAHDHAEYVPGCYRCEMTKDELGVTADATPTKGNES